MIQDKILRSDPNRPDKTPGDKVRDAVRLIKSAAAMHNYTVAFSGGKDSVMLDFLCKEANIHAPLVYNVSTIDPPHTIAFCQRRGAIINRPQQTFLDLIRRKGWPSMFARFCCAYFKERYIADYLMVGVRRDESVRRSKRYQEPEVCRLYPGKLKTVQLLPLLDFTAEDIAWLTAKHSIEHHPNYYDAEGRFRPERRLGCIGCPLKYDRGVADFQQYPRMFRQWVRAFLDFSSAHGRDTTDTCWRILHYLFYSKNNHVKYTQIHDGLFDYDPREILKQHFPETRLDDLF